MQTSLLQHVVAALQARKGYWVLIAARSGVPYHTIAKIARGVTPNPGVLTVQKLADVCKTIKRPRNRGH